MNKSLPILLLLPVLFFSFCAGTLFAANPVPEGCISLTGFYPRAPDDVTYYAFGNPLATYQGYKPYFRVFIPPGTVVEDLYILEYGKQKAVARHNMPPMGLPELPPIGYTASNPYILSELEYSDQWAFESDEGVLYITTDSFYPNIDISRAGWLYIKVGGGDYSYVYTTQFIAKVDTKEYNKWWDKYIQNEAGWNTYVQNVGTYIDPTASAPILAVSPVEQKVQYTGGTTTFEVSNSGTGTMPWTAAAVSEGDWLKIESGSSGSNGGIITCSFPAYTEVEERTGTIEVIAVGATGSPKFVTVTQAPAPAKPILAVSPLEQKVQYPGGTTTFEVSNSGTGTMFWTATVTEGGSWLSVTPQSGTNTGTITCSYTANETTSGRTGKIRVTADGVPGSSTDVTVTQAAAPAKPILTVDPLNRDVPNTSDTTTFVVSNSGTGIMSWTASVTEGGTWLSIAPLSGTNTGTITCSYTANEATSGRTGTIRVTADGANGSSSTDVTVTQAPAKPILKVDPPNQDVPNTSGTTTFNVENGGTGTMRWTASVTEGGTWLSVTPSSGMNTGTITCSYTANETTSARTGTIRVTADGANGSSPADVTVTQAPAKPILKVDPPNQDVPNTSGTITFDISNSGTGTMFWTASVTEGGSWLSIAPVSGTNTGKITCYFAANDGSSERTGIIQVTAAGATPDSVSVRVTQETVSIAVLSSLVPVTGLKKCYDNSAEIVCPELGQPFYGQDENFPLHPMSYTKLDANGAALLDLDTSWAMVKDNVTGLIWEMKNNKNNVPDYANPNDADNTYVWNDSSPAFIESSSVALSSAAANTAEFIKALNDANYGGYRDWRLPTAKELAFIVNYGISSPEPRVDAYFTDTVPAFYWSSNTYDRYPYDAWGVDFSSGASYYRDKFDGNYVRAVRGGQSESQVNSADRIFGAWGGQRSASAIYKYNDEDTVTDTSTGLMWGPSFPVNAWENALSYCVMTSNPGNYTDWRLPTIKELQSLVDFSLHDPCVNTLYFRDMDASFYWSSTTEASDMSRAWGVDFGDGNSGYNDKTHFGYSIRPVRSIPLLSVSPASQKATNEAGTTTFNVSNSGNITKSWKAEVTSGISWLSITSGADGTDVGTIICAFTANTDRTAEDRTGTVRVTAYDGVVEIQVVDVTVTQSSQLTKCTATLDENYLLRVPILLYEPTSGPQSYFWADLLRDQNSPKIYELMEFGALNNPSESCIPSKLDSELRLQIFDVLFTNETHLWMYLEYNTDISTDGKYYFDLIESGVVAPN
jgi:hypothetical protein